MTSPFLDIRDFACGYPGGFQLKPVSLSLIKGSITGIIGPNGSGKTTLFRGIIGELQKKSGSVLLGNQDLLTIHRKEKARLLAIVTQDTESIGMTVEEYVLLGRIPHHNSWQFFDSAEDVEIAEHYMELTGVIHKRDKKLDQLSGGERQLAAIARALAQEPTLLLLDEPTASLDISHQGQILNLLQKLNQELELTVLMVIHDLNLASEYCDYLTMISNGAVYTQGTPEQVLTYLNIEKVYNSVVVTRTNPISGKPVIFMVSEKSLKAQPINQVTNQPSNQSPSNQL